MLTAYTFVAVVIAAIFLWDIVHRWWRETAWRRQWRRRGPHDED